jgi:hypothetical protein
MSATTNRGAGRTPAPRRGRWSKEQREVIAALRQLAEEIDRTPTQAIWRASGRQPCWQSICRLFGSWSAAIKAARLPVNRRPWHVFKTPEILDQWVLIRMREWHYEHGRAPTGREWDAAGEIPGSTTVRLRFGSWTNAIRAAELTPRKVNPRTGAIWTRATIIEALRRDAQRRGRPPTAVEWKSASSEHPCLMTVWRYFGSFKAGLRAAGLA